MKGIFFNYKETKENLPYFKNSIKVNVLPILSLWGLRAFHAGPKMGKKNIFLQKKNPQCVPHWIPKYLVVMGRGQEFNIFLQKNKIFRKRFRKRAN